MLTIHVHRPSACTRTDRMPAQSEHMQYCHNGGMVPVEISLLTSCTGTVHARSARTIFCRGQLMVHSAHVFTQVSVQSKHTLQCTCITRGDAPWNRMRLCMLPLALVILCKNKVEVWSLARRTVFARHREAHRTDVHGVCAYFMLLIVNHCVARRWIRV